MNSYSVAERINSDVNASVTYKTDLEQLALKWKDEIDPRVYDAMMKWEVSITS